MVYAASAKDFKIAPSYIKKPFPVAYNWESTKLKQNNKTPFIQVSNFQEGRSYIMNTDTLFSFIFLKL